MRLSNIKGDKALDVIADLVVPIANIAIDEEASDLFIKKPLPVGMTPKQFVLARAKKALPTLLKTHKDDVIDILAAISMEDREVYKDSLTIPSLLKDAYEIITDDLFLELFTSAQSKEAEESCGSVLENTGDEA